MTKWTLLASAPDLEGIGECIARFYGGERKPLEFQASTLNPHWAVLRSEGGAAIAGVRVIHRRGRYRFEMSEEI